VRSERVGRAIKPLCCGAARISEADDQVVGVTRFQHRRGDPIVRGRDFVHDFQLLESRRAALEVGRAKKPAHRQATRRIESRLALHARDGAHKRGVAIGRNGEPLRATAREDVIAGSVLVVGPVQHRVRAIRAGNDIHAHTREAVAGEHTLASADDDA
jgi:hypothetical protein